MDFLAKFHQLGLKHCRNWCLERKGFKYVHSSRLEVACTQASVRVIGLESSKKMYEEARRELQSEAKYSLLWGTVIDPRDEFLEINQLSELESVWWIQDKYNLQESPNCLEKIPLQIDLLILDGGEFTSYSEFKTLKSRCKRFIVLDDVKSRKNREVHSELIMDDTWALIVESNDRNGFSIWCKKIDSIFGLSQT